MHFRHLCLCGVFLCVQSLVFPAIAAEEDRGTYNLLIENDRFANTDRHYTHGTRFSWLSPADDVPEWSRKAAEHLPLFATTGTLRIGYGLGQSIFTPEDTDARALVPGDRPYAGWLYGAMSLHSVNNDPDDPEFKELESIEINLGIVGPQAFGQETQDLVHNIRVIDRFEGWDNQLKNEPGVLLMYERKWRLADPARLGPLQIDFVPYAGASLGNVLTHFNAGGSVRYGHNIPKDFGPPGLIKGLTSMDAIPEENWSLYAFAGAEGRYVARNIFLDGNTFADSHSVKKNRWVADLSIGIALIIWRVKFSYTNALRTREFVGQDNNARFGSISASWQMKF